MKNIYLVVGKSGAGKDTVVNVLCERYGYKKLPSYTTRPPREDSKDLKSHIFANVETYYKDKKNKSIVAETFYHNNFYWATEQQVDESDLYIVEVQGVKSLKERYYNKPIVVIAIEADEKTRYDRMQIRGDNEQFIKERIEGDKRDFRELKDVADVVVSNDSSLDDVVETIHNIIQKYEQFKIIGVDISK